MDGLHLTKKGTALLNQAWVQKIREVMPDIAEQLDELNSSVASSENASKGGESDFTEPRSVEGSEGFNRARQPPSGGSDHRKGRPEGNRGNFPWRGQRRTRGRGEWSDQWNTGGYHGSDGFQAGVANHPRQWNY